jgi:hypothetical protein
MTQWPQGSPSTAHCSRAASLSSHSGEWNMKGLRAPYKYSIGMGKFTGAADLNPPAMPHHCMA